MGCDKGPQNPEQIAFLEKISALKSKKQPLDTISFRSEDASGKIAPADISTQIKKIEQEVWTLLKDSHPEANQWYATISSVQRNGSEIILHSTYGSQFYYLKIFDPNSVKIAKKFLEGDKITFSGNLGAEMSSTVFGALSSQEFRIYPTSVLSRHGEIKQASSDVTARISKDHLKKAKKENDEILQDRIIKECKDSLRSLMKYPESVSFSWFKRKFIQRSENKWTYFDVLEAMNDSGGSPPIRFECDAIVSGEHIEVSINVLDGS